MVLFANHNIIVFFKNLLRSTPQNFLLNFLDYLLAFTPFQYLDFRTVLIANNWLNYSCNHISISSLSKFISTDKYKMPSEIANSLLVWYRAVYFTASDLFENQIYRQNVIMNCWYFEVFHLIHRIKYAFGVFKLCVYCMDPMVL